MAAGKIIITSPDGLPITPRGFTTRAAADAGLSKWIQRFAAQGYYSTAAGERIALADLRARCQIHDGNAAGMTTIFEAVPLKPAPLAIHATCPDCGFSGNVFTLEGFDGSDVYDNGHDRGRGGFRSRCESCGHPFIIEGPQIAEITLIALILSGEAAQPLADLKKAAKKPRK